MVRVSGYGRGRFGVDAGCGSGNRPCSARTAAIFTCAANKNRGLGYGNLRSTRILLDSKDIFCVVAVQYISYTVVIFFRIAKDAPCVIVTTLFDAPSKIIGIALVMANPVNVFIHFALWKLILALFESFDSRRTDVVAVT